MIPGSKLNRNRRVKGEGSLPSLIVLLYVIKFFRLKNTRRYIQPG